MKTNILHTIKRRFLADNDAVKNWRFIGFSVFLVLIVIASAHQAESKVYTIAKLDKEVKELRSEYVDVRGQLMKLKMESKVARKVQSRGLKTSDVPPKKIKVQIIK